MLLVATSDYDFRGESQTQNQPALQLSFDWSDAPRWKAGLFMSNVDFDGGCACGNPRLEISPYAEWLRPTASGVTLGLGASYYAYLVGGGAGLDYGEPYVEATYREARVALSYTPNYDGSSTHLNLGAWYVSADDALALPADFSLTGHVGYSSGPYWTRLGGGKKLDYSVGLGRPLGHFELILQYIASKRTERGAGDPVDGEGRALLMLETHLPWSRSGT